MEDLCVLLYFIGLGGGTYWFATHRDYDPLQWAAITLYHWNPYLSYCILASITGVVLGSYSCFRGQRWIDKISGAFYVLLFLVLVTFCLVCFLGIPDTVQVICFTIGYMSAQKYWSYPASVPARPFEPVDQTVFGTSEWASADYLIQQGLNKEDGYFLGVARHPVKVNAIVEIPLYYNGDRHLLTVAPTRGGKGVSTIIPNLLTYEGSALVIDPKGENARVTAARRGDGHADLDDNADLWIPGMGQKVLIVDPWGIVADEESAACFNPMDWLDPNDPDINENAMILWDSIIMEDSDE